MTATPMTMSRTVGRRLAAAAAMKKQVGDLQGEQGRPQFQHAWPHNRGAGSAAALTSRDERAA